MKRFKLTPWLLLIAVLALGAWSFDMVEIKSGGGKTTLKLSSTAADTGITIGGDTNLYRPSADLLKTDDEFEIGVAGGKDTLRLTSTSDGTGITFGGDSNLYRASSFPNGIMTDDSFSIGLWSTYGNTSSTISAGALTIGSTMVIVDTEAAAATDDLDCIIASPVPVGNALLILIPANDARTVVLRDRQTCGSGLPLWLATAGNFSMDNISDRVVLLFVQGTAWVEIARSNNGI